MFYHFFSSFFYIFFFSYLLFFIFFFTVEVQRFYNHSVRDRSIYSEKMAEVLPDGTEVRIEGTTLFLQKTTLEMKDGTNILGLIIFCTVFGVILGQLGPEGKQRIF